MVNVDRQLIRVSAILAYATLPGGQRSSKSAFLIFSKETRIGTLRLRLHGRGFQSKRCHDLETASKTTRFRRVYTEPIQLLNPTVYVKKLSHQTRVLPGRMQNRRLPFFFVTLQERIDEKVNISRHLCLFIAVCLSVYRE